MSPEGGLPIPRLTWSRPGAPGITARPPPDAEPARQHGPSGTTARLSDRALAAVLHGGYFIP